MRIKNLLLIKWIILLFLLIFMLTPGLCVTADIQVNLRVYEGLRKVKDNEPVVITSYYFKPFFSGNLVLDVDFWEEKKEIKKIFNLIDIKLINQAQWAWKHGKIEKQFQLFILNGHEILIHLTLLKKKDNFGLEVIEKLETQNNKILETEIILPQKKTVVLGFEDSTENPYFLSFKRKKDEKISPSKQDNLPALKVPANKRPKRLKLVRPKYPEDALKNKIQGIVQLELTTDIYGRVKGVKLIDGHPELNKAAIEAVKQWIYEPCIIDGVPRPVKFVVNIVFWKR